MINRINLIVAFTLLAGGIAAYGGVVWHENFEGYGGSQVAMEVNWPAARSGPALMLNTEQARSGSYSAKSDEVAHRVSSRATGQIGTGPGSLRLYVYDPFQFDPTNPQTPGVRVRFSVEVNQSSSRWHQVALREEQSQTHFWWREGGCGYTGCTDGSPQISSVPRTQGWNEIVLTWGDTSINGNGGSIYINGNLVHQGSNLDDLANIIFIGNDWDQATDEHFYFDDITLYDHIVDPTVPEECGDWGYLKADLDEDCYVDFNDLLIMSEDWLLCTDPADPLNCVLLL